MISPPSFNIRPASKLDQVAVQSLIFSVLHEYGLKPDPDYTDLDLFDIEKHYAEPDAYFGVVESEQGIVATLGLLKLDSENQVSSCELRKMYALPSARGQGLGRFLLDFAIRKAQRWHCQRMILETASVLKEAIALYQRYGFQVYHPRNITCRCDMAMELMLPSIKTSD